MGDEPCRVAVLGAGSWGTALAILLARNGHRVVLWGRDAGRVATMARDGANEAYLPGHRFPASLEVTADLGAALTGAQPLLLVVPSHAFRAVVEQVARLAPAPRGVAWATKGFAPGAATLLHEVVAETFGAATPMAVLSGPTFAREIAGGLPAAVTCAGRPEAFARELAALFHTDRFRVYTSDDIVGVQVGGAVKNVLAIAAGVSDGLGFGANARAALITRGLAEIVRLGTALGGRPETFMGLAGLGDLVLTCTDDQSRNRRFGLFLARGASVAEAERAVGQVVEGVRTAQVVAGVAARLGVDMPISEQVEAVIHRGRSAEEAVRVLLAREPGAEFG